MKEESKTEKENTEIYKKMRCKECNYFFMFHQWGQCRKYPPQIKVYEGKANGKKKCFWYPFPEVRDNYWCGEFKSK